MSDRSRWSRIQSGVPNQKPRWSDIAQYADLMIDRCGGAGRSIRTMEWSASGPFVPASFKSRRQRGLLPGPGSLRSGT